jgi:hypothetical protein
MRFQPIGRKPCVESLFYKEVSKLMIVGHDVRSAGQTTRYLVSYKFPNPVKLNETESDPIQPVFQRAMCRASAGSVSVL